MRKLNVAVLGSNGFIGNYLVQNLHQYNILPVNRNIVDLTDAKQTKTFFNSNKIDYVINCAIHSDSSMTAFSPQVAINNMLIFSNLYSNRNKYSKLINFGSGAEFDRRYSIDEMEEEKIFSATPLDHYGMSKNISSRISFETENFYTLRAFGVFFSGEPEKRLLQKVLSNSITELADKYFDYFSLDDILKVVELYLSDNIQIKDVNLVYSKKILLSEFVRIFCEVKGLKINFQSHKDELNYTGSSKKIEQLNLKFTPLEKSFERYK